MFRIRFHGRGGQGMKTASRILGRAFFLEGFEVQDAPRYGAERRGAPIFAYVRAAHQAINERGIIQQPDLVIVADDSLMAVPAAGVLAGVHRDTVMLVYSNISADTWKDRLATDCTLLVLPAGKQEEDPLERRYAGASCAGAAAQLCGVISPENFQLAIHQELEAHGEAVVQKNIQHAMEAYAQMRDDEGIVKEGGAISAQDYTDPQWTRLPFEEAQVSAPSIHAAATSEQSQTGLWRTMRPVIEYDRCNRCWWVCSTYCPDGAIEVTENRYPKIDYDHCKGCMVCVTQCPPHAIVAIPESEAQQQTIKEPPA